MSPVFFYTHRITNSNFFLLFTKMKALKMTTHLGAHGNAQAIGFVPIREGRMVKKVFANLKFSMTGCYTKERKEELIGNIEMLGGMVSCCVV